MDVDKLVPEAGNLEGFFEQFSVFASAPGGVEYLRKLILQLAIRGRLVLQNTNDEPANELLDKILYQKEQLLWIMVLTHFDRQLKAFEKQLFTEQAELFNNTKHCRLA